MKDRFPALQPWLSLACRLLLAGVFLIAGVPKLLDSEGTVRSVRAFHLMPETFVRPFGYALPLVEIAVAVLLLLGLVTRIGALITAGMMAMFLFGISMAWIRGYKIDCGCFGNAGTTVVDPVPGYIRVLLRDSGELLAALFLARWPFSKFALDGTLGITEPLPARPRVAA